MGLSKLTEPRFVDANIFLFTIWDDDLYGPSCKEFLNRVEAGELKGSSTIHTQPELLSKSVTCFEDVSALHYPESKRSHTNS